MNVYCYFSGQYLVDHLTKMVIPGICNQQNFPQGRMLIIKSNGTLVPANGCHVSVRAHTELLTKLAGITKQQLMVAVNGQPKTETTIEALKIVLQKFPKPETKKELKSQIKRLQNQSLVGKTPEAIKQIFEEIEDLKAELKTA